MHQLEESHKASFKNNVEAFHRICNLASKAETKQVDESLFQEESEQALYTAWNNVHPQFVEMMSKRNVEAAYELLSSLREAIVAYFNSVMVMAEDAAVKRNRLATLALIADDIHKIADLSKLVWA